MKLKIKDFYNQHISHEIRLTLGLCLVVLTVGCLLQVMNSFTTHYPGYSYLSMRWVWLSPAMIALLCYARVVKNAAPRLAFFTESYSVYFFVVLAGMVLANGIQYTPFFPVDYTLLYIDQMLGVSTPALLKWTAMHPVVKHTLISAYNFLAVEVFLVPLILPWFNDRYRIYRLFVAMLISYLIGGLIYYFLPTAAPASIIHSRYFIPEVYHTVHKFYHVHGYLAATGDGPGLIAFPSFHVIWAVLFTDSLRGKPYWFYPILVINILVIVSTLLLGWHYLLDVVAGILLAVFAILVRNRMLGVKAQS